MNQERTRDAIAAFRTAEAAVNELLSNAGELTASAEAIRDTDESLKSLAEALGIASKQWAEIAVELKSVASEVQAAGKLLQKAEPQELMNAIDETTASIGELRRTTVTVSDATDRVTSQLEQLTSRMDAVAEASTSLREAMVAKLDLQQTSIVSLHDRVDRLDTDLARRHESLTSQQDSHAADALKATNRAIYAGSAAAALALVAVVLAFVL